MASSSLLLLVILCSAASVLGQSSTNSTGTLSFRGPGYIACPLADFTANGGCGGFNVDVVNCTSGQINQECNFTAENAAESIDATFTILYIPLVCECFVAADCPNTCEYFTGDVPALPPAVSAPTPIVAPTTVDTPTTTPIAAPTAAQSPMAVPTTAQPSSGAVLVQNSTNSTGLSFRGPGYIACDFEVDSLDYDCGGYSFDYENCTAEQIAQECNYTDDTIRESFDATYTVIYSSLLCECFVATNCPTSCEYFPGDLPTLPPTGFVNFSGVGNVTCPTGYFASTENMDSCYPTVIDNSTCGTCDFEAALTFDDDFFGYEPGDENITFPLPCECIVLLGCPGTCTFVAIGEAPVAAPTSNEILGQNGTNSTGLSFRGPGYIACDIADFDINGKVCNFTADLVNCTTAQYVQECNFTNTIPTTDAAYSLIYIPMICECFVAFDCPTSCEYFTGEQPTQPPVSANANFTGLGNVICPVLDLDTVQFNDFNACLPTVIDNSTCGTCDFEAAITFDDDFFGYEQGDTKVTIPLLCECIALLGCPDTCTFVAMDNTTIVTPTADTFVAMDNTTIAAPTADETPVPNATAPAVAPVRGATAGAPSTSAAFAKTTKYSYKYCAVMTVFVLISVSLL